MTTINEFLDGILEDFIEYIDSQEQLCNLLDVHFDAGKVPDYSDVHVQQLYLLRSAYAYAFEYKMMYDDLLSRMQYNDAIKVTSIGCGNLIDYWSLSRVIGQNCKITYRGIDTIDWSYKMNEGTIDDVKFCKGNVLELFENANSFSSDVYIFPKSISEFTLEDIHTLARCFSADNIKKNIVHFMFSLRKEQGSIRRDVRKTSVLYDHMLQCGFHSENTKGKYWVLNDAIRDKKIREIDDEFSHPDNVIDYLQELYYQCKNRTSCNLEHNCKYKLTRWPILGCQYIAWQTFTFER